MASSPQIRLPPILAASRLCSEPFAAASTSSSPNTRIIEIHYTHPDKNLAAAIVNTLAITYKEANYRTKFESTMQASDWLSKQLVDLQIKVETSQEKLVRYQKEHETSAPTKSKTSFTSKLEELNRELTVAEGDRMQREAAYRQVQSGDPAMAASVVASGASGNSSGSQLDRLRGQQADLRIKVAEASTQFGPSYPKVAELNNQLKQLDTEIQNETTKVISGIRDQYEVALQHESSSPPISRIRNSKPTPSMKAPSSTAC